MINGKCPEHGVEYIKHWVQNNGTEKLVSSCPQCAKLTRVKFVCSKCGYENDYWQKPGETLIQCKNCINGSKVNSSVQVRKIPDWRINVDSATEEEVLNSDSKTFGMPVEDPEYWKKHYANESYEKERLKQHENKQKSLEQEVLG